MKKFQVGRYAADNKGIGIRGPQSTIYYVAGFDTTREHVYLRKELNSKQNKLLRRLIWTMDNPIAKEFCFLNEKTRKGIIVPLDVEK